MSANSEPKRPRPGRPKDESLHQAALAAARSLLAEQGMDRMSFQSVAKRAGVSRPTLYRHWDTVADLAAEALESQRPPLTIPDTGSLRGDLLQGAQDFIAHYATPLGRQAILDLLRAHMQNASIARAWQSAYGLPRQQNFKILFTRAVERGELPQTADIDTMMFILSASLLQTCLQDRTADPQAQLRQIQAVIDLILSAD